MLIIGTGGCARQLLPDLMKSEWGNALVFYDDALAQPSGIITELYPVLRTKEQAANYFQTIDNRFIIAIANSDVRAKMFEVMSHLGGYPFSFHSPTAEVSAINTFIGKGTVLMSGAFVETSVHIGEGSLLNVRAMISHDCRIGDFCEFGPSVVILGTSSIGNRTLIGASAVVLKNIQIGENVIVGAGAVVNRDVPDNTVVAGVPAREIKKR